MKSVLVFLCVLPALLLCIQKGNAQAVISVGAVAGHVTSCQGAQSMNEEYQRFQLLGFNLTNPVTIQVTSGFLVSDVENSGFHNSISINPQKGTVIETIYIRLGPMAPVGSVNGTVTINTTGVAQQSVAVNGTVLAMPIAHPEPNIIVLDGATLPRLNFEGTNSNTYMWTNSNPNIGLSASGIDSLPQFRVLTNSNDTVTATITVTPVLAGTAYVTNNGSASVSIINTLTNTLDTTISSGGKDPASETLSPDGTKLYVLNVTAQTISVINTVTNKLVSVFDLPPAFYPYQIAVNHDGTLIYVMNFGTSNVVVIDAQTGGQVTSFAANGAFPSELAFSASGNLLYVGANETAAQGGLTAFSYPTNTPVIRSPVPAYGGGPKSPPPFTYLNMVFSPDSTRLYLTNGSTVSVFNTQTSQVIAKLAVGYDGMGSPLALAISPDGKDLYVLVTGIGTTSQVQIFDTSNNKLLQFIPIDGPGPSGLCINPDGTYLYVSCAGSNTVAAVNTKTYLVTTNIGVGNAPEINTFCIKPGGCFGDPITFTITVLPAPVPTIILSTDTLKALTTTYGTPSPSETLVVSGKLLRGNITLTAPKGFEVSSDNLSFSTTLTIDALGTLPATILYMRLAATDIVGVYSGNIVLTSPGAGTGNVFIPKSPVTPATLTITADNKAKVVDAPNPPLTASYKGFENNDTPASLVYPPALNTTALTNSPVGSYPITASNAYSANYNILYIRGTLTITPDIIIPNAFTPNGDGINDTWDIQKIGNYPDCSVQVFNRYGNLVYSSTGYSIPWDGTYKGIQLPTGTYYYLINLYAGIPVLSGFVTIIR
jgi:gliding motility-associated-like protein